MPHDSPLTTLATAVLLGVAGQVLASLTRLPAIVFLLVLGLVGGPWGLGLVQPAELGAGLPAITSALVALILFEGGLTLRPAVLREALVPVRRLITYGAAGTLLGAAVLSHLLAGLPWPLAFLFGALVMVTGPTVIAPILRRVRLQPRLHAVLKSESILIDPIGVIVAVVMLEYVVGLDTREASGADALLGFFTRIGIGGLVGAFAGATAAALVRLPLVHKHDNDHLVHLGAVGLALGAYVAAERCQAESGILAVIVSGLILAAAPIPFRREVEKYKEHLTTLGVSVLFILLAANLDLGRLFPIAGGEVALLGALMLVVRPAAVWLSTWGTGLGRREKAYLSLMAPRGIVAAAMASYFAGQLRAHGVAGADRIEALVFLTIAATVFVQGGWAALLARLLRVRAERAQGVLLVGVNEWSLRLAEELRSRGRFLLFVDDNPAHCEAAQEQGFAVRQADATDRETYEAPDLAAIGLLLAMTPNDAVNTLACEAAAGWLGEKNTLQIVSKPAGEGRPARVRLAGRWALPTTRSHREVAQLLRQGRLQVTAEPCPGATRLTPGLRSSRGPLVPLLLEEKGGLHIAVEGHTCSAGAVVVGLLESDPVLHGVGTAA